MTRRAADDSARGATWIRVLGTEDLRDDEIANIREIMEVAFGDDPEERFLDADWAHAVGGRHVVLEAEGAIIGHASVVERELHIAGVPLRTGYVEAVAIQPSFHGRGFGSQIMTVVDAEIRARYELGALGTGRHAFYERLGWRTWRGPSSVRTMPDERRTTDEDGYILVLETPSTPITPLDLWAPISCDWREGDVW